MDYCYRRFVFMLGCVTVIAWGAFDSYMLFQIMQAVSK